MRKVLKTSASRALRLGRIMVLIQQIENARASRKSNAARKQKETAAIVARRDALQRAAHSNGVTLYDGPSMFTGEPIIAVATFESDNDKTGNMITLWIMPRDISPSDALRGGLDICVCNGCGHKMMIDGVRHIRTCYVNMQVVTDRWYAFHRGEYPHVMPGTALWAAVLADRVHRYGGWGDIAALPFERIEAIAGSVAGWTAYTHSAFTCDQRIRRYAMASVDTEEQAIAAVAMGWRFFRPRKDGAPLLANEIVCPGTPEGRKRSTCEACLLCDGKRDDRDRRANIGTIVHGTAARRFDPSLQRYAQPVPVQFLRSRAEVTR